MDVVVALSDAAGDDVEAVFAAVAGAWCVVGVDVGSALSTTPVMDWKSSFPAEVVVVVVVMMGVLFLQWVRALVACCAGSGAFAGKGLDSSEARVQWAVKVDEADLTSTRRAVVGQGRSAGNSLSKPGECGAQPAWAFASDAMMCRGLKV
jgi:hypothetical protein